MQTRSFSVYCRVSPMKKPLLRMLWCDRVAPLGKPVVPEVYWMLIGSSNCNSASRARSAATTTWSAAQGGQPAGDLVEHVQVVGLAEAGGEHQGGDARLAEGVGQLRGPVGRVD